MLHTEELQGRHTVTVKILQDGDLLDPSEDWEGVRLAVWHSRLTNPSRELKSPDDVVRAVRAHGGHAVKVYLYEHSGCVYRAGDANPFRCPWDSGFVGMMLFERTFLEARGWRRVSRTRHRELLDWANGALEDYTAWANGHGAGFVLEDARGAELDSCWGYYRLECAVSAARESAQVFLN